PATSRPFGRRCARSTGGNAPLLSSQGINAGMLIASEPLVGALADQTACNARARVASRLCTQIVGVGVHDNRSADNAVLGSAEADTGNLHTVDRNAVRVSRDIAEISGMAWCAVGPCVCRARGIEVAAGA